LKNSKQEYFLFQWQFISSAARNDLSRIIAVVPIVGYLILFNDYVAETLQFNVLAGARADDPSPFFIPTDVKLRLVFLGSLLVLVANIASRIFSPNELEHSSNGFVFSDRVFESFSAEEVKAMETEVYDAAWSPRTSFFDNNTDLRLGKRQTPILLGFQNKQFMLRDNSEYLRNLAREWWCGKMHEMPIARYFTLASVVSGYLLLSVSTLDIVQAVLRDILGNI